MIFDRHKNRGQLGPLESQLLQLLWRRGSGTVRELLEGGEVSGAYTTLMTTLDRLHKKGLLDRSPEGRAYRYSPKQSQHEYKGDMVRQAIRDLLLLGTPSPTRAPLSFLVDAVSEHDRALLDELQQMIEQKRRELDEQERS